MPGSEHLAGFRTDSTIMVWIFLLTAVTMLELLVSADLAEETSALLTLKAAWGNPALLRSWTANSTTNNGTSDVCSNWAFVTCDSNGTAVTELVLHDSGLSGTLVSQLGHLSSLVVLDLGSNGLNGAIPNTFDNLTQLTYLDLDSNRFNGTILNTFVNLTQLTYLDLSSNYLSGETTSIWSLNSLQTLSLSSNEFYGTIPKALGKLTQLSSLDFSYNHFHGSVLHIIANLTSLQFINLQSCQFWGVMPTTFGKLSKLSYIDFIGNNFYGSIPESIGDLTSLTYLNLQGCQFSGVMPTTLGKLTKLSLLVFSENNITGSLSENIGNLSSLTVLDLFDCPIFGVIPTTLGKLTRLSFLELTRTNLNGSIPNSIGNLSSLLTLELEHCRFSGEIPTVLGKLTKLVTLLLDNNYFDGFIPESIGNLTSLTTIDLSNNHVNGSIPKSIGGLISLISMSLYTNDLVGPIPSELGLLKALKTLDLHDNNLTGSIPDVLGDLRNLNTLSLAINYFNGNIPTSILKLPNLRSFSIEDNCFNGTMPPLVTTLVLIDTNNCFDNESCNTKCVQKIKTTNQGNSAKNLIIVLFGVIGGLLFVGALLLTFVCKKKQKHRIDILNLPVHLKQYTFLEVMEATDNLNTKVGEGGFSTVYKATFKDGSLAAVKRFNKTQRQENFEFEIEVLAHLNHRYLVNLIGYCSEKDELMLMFDFMEGGNLFQSLHGESLQDPLTWGDRMKIFMNVARGIEYLHFGCTPPLIHRDIKSSNILLSNPTSTTPVNAKLADFGLGKHTIIEVSYHEIVPTMGSEESSPCSTRVVGTPGYVDPEYMTTFQVCPKSDVYSYGVVLLEILTGRKALFLGELLVDWVKSHLDEKDVWSIMDSKLVGKNIPEQQLMGVVELALQCTKQTSDTRPSIREVLKSLVEIFYSESNVNDFSSSFKSDTS